MTELLTYRLSAVLLQLWLNAIYHSWSESLQKLVQQNSVYHTPVKNRLGLNIHSLYNKFMCQA